MLNFFYGFYEGMIIPIILFFCVLLSMCNPQEGKAAREKAKRERNKEVYERIYAVKNKRDEFFLEKVPEEKFCCTLETSTQYIIKNVSVYSYRTDKETDVYSEPVNSNERLDITCPYGKYDIKILAYEKKTGINKKLIRTFTLRTKYANVLIKENGTLFFDEGFIEMPYPIEPGRIERSEIFLQKIPESNFCCTLENHSKYIVQKIIIYSPNNEEIVVFSGKLNRDEQIDMVYPFGKYSILIYAIDKETEEEKRFFETFKLKTQLGTIAISEEGDLMFDKNFKVSKKK